MSDERDPRREASTDDDLREAAPAEDARLRALVKRSLVDADDAPPDHDAALLASVQRRLRVRSKGKFYGDGWSTTESRLSYALVAAMMLVTIVAVYLALGPTGFSLR